MLRVTKQKNRYLFVQNNHVLLSISEEIDNELDVSEVTSPDGKSLDKSRSQPSGKQLDGKLVELLEGHNWFTKLFKNGLVKEEESKSGCGVTVVKRSTIQEEKKKDV
jgi:hypothetical protein